MSDVSLGVLFATLVVLIVLSAFFSSSETGMMALNRYRLRHLVKHKHRAAMRASQLLHRPDRLIGLILLGNNFVNILASSLATVIALRLMGEAGIAVAAFILTFVILIFAEVAPKTLAALYPERIAFPASRILSPLLRIFYPLVATVNVIANGLLKLCGVTVSATDSEQLSTDELRTVVNEAGALIGRRHRRMLTSILDLENVSVDDIMIPKPEVNGLNLDDERPLLLDQITNSQHTLLPVYRGDVDNTLGVLHLRKCLDTIHRGDWQPERLLELAEEPYFVPSGTPLSTQLRNFQRHKARIALVVDEYGDLEGIITLADILEEIVGEFTTDLADHSTDIHPQEDGTYLIDASVTVRELNRAMGWDLPTDGPKTLNGIILEYLESIPEPGTSLLLSGYPVEIIQTAGSGIKTVRISPAWKKITEPSV